MDLFGEAAASLCTATHMLLGWRPSEFWEATPAELLLAVQSQSVTTAGPDMRVIDALRERFPDEREVISNG